ncbi:MAG TPA: DUF3775 domain-containing protein [Rhizomicrobium sp.]|jgi:hypothetical protein|nr:DUF3775 domain-containing protein [Rhizomicrobium sp.]
MPLETEPPVDPDNIDLGIATEKVCHIIVKARAWDAKEGDADPDSGSNPADDGMADVLEDQPDDATRRELVSFIGALDEEEQVNLVALAWVGRGTYDLSEWQEALETARNEHAGGTAEYLLGLPLLGDYLEEGLAVFNESCDEFNARL